MSHPINIGGESFEIAWDQQTARSYAYRASKIGGAPSMRDLANPKRAAAAVTDLLWLLLPPTAAAKYRSPEELFVALDHESEAESIHSALLAVMEEMVSTDEKKSSSKNLRSQKSS